MATLKENYSDSFDNTGTNIGGAIWCSQTFLAESNYSLEYVQLKLYKNASPGLLTCYIENTTADKPNGDILGTATMDGDGLLASPGQYETLTFSTPVIITSGATYAIVIRSADDAVGWRYDSTSPAYSGGSMVRSTNSGSTWTIFTSNDLVFKNYGTAAATFEVTSTIPIVSGMSAIKTVYTVYPVTATIPIISGITATKLVSSNWQSGTFQTYKRLVVAGNDKFYYEDI